MSRDWPKTLRSTTNFAPEPLDATNLCSGGPGDTLSNFLLSTTNAFNASTSGGAGGVGSSRNATIHHIPIYHPIGHLPALGLSSEHHPPPAALDPQPTNVVQVQQHPATIHHQILGTSANFLNFAIAGGAKGLSEAPQFEYATVTAAQNERKGPALLLPTNQSAPPPQQQASGMGDESLDQKFFVFHNSHNVQSAPSPQPPPQPATSSSSASVSAGGSLNVLSLSAAAAVAGAGGGVNHPGTHPSSLHQNSLPLLCANASAAASLSAMDGVLHTAKEQKVRACVWR